VATLEKLESLGKILEGILSTQFSNTLLFKPKIYKQTYKIKLGGGSSTSTSDCTTFTFSILVLGTKKLSHL
jgi:hypothetical protein